MTLVEWQLTLGEWYGRPGLEEVGDCEGEEWFIFFFADEVLDGLGLVNIFLGEGFRGSEMW